METAHCEDVHGAGLAKVVEGLAARCLFTEDDRLNDVGLFSIMNSGGDSLR